MGYSTLKPWQEIGETGIVHDRDSLYGRFHHISDPRGAKGKQYSLVMLVELSGLLGLKRLQMPCHSTIRRVFHTTLEEAEFDRMAQEITNKSKQGQARCYRWMVKR